MNTTPEFTDDEIQEELARLGYTNIPKDKLQEFRKDLDQLILHEKSKGSSVNTSHSSGFNNSNCGFGGHSWPIVTDFQPEVGQGEGIPVKVGPEPASFVTKQVSDGGQENKNVSSRRPRTAPSVPGYYSLYELPRCEKFNTQDINDDMSDADSEARRQMKRKTLRRDQEGSKFIDESVSESDAGSVADPHEGMQHLVLRDQWHRPCSAPSSQDPPPYRLSAEDPRPPSVIYSSTEHPHTKNLRKSDPVARYQQMQQLWALQQAPGEKQHKGLRWNIREQMLANGLPEKKQQRVYVPNNYMVPTDKKRKSLRWQIRMDMAQGNMPPCGVFQDC